MKNTAPHKILLNKIFKENCSAGCPCSGFDCLEPTSLPTTTSVTMTTTSTTSETTTIPSGKAVLVLSTRLQSNKPFIVDFQGKYFGFLTHGFYFLGNVNDDLDFDYGDGTFATTGCGATLNDVFYYFGGTARRQVKSLK